MKRLLIAALLVTFGTAAQANDQWTARLANGNGTCGNYNGARYGLKVDGGKLWAGGPKSVGDLFRDASVAADGSFKKDYKSFDRANLTMAGNAVTRAIRVTNRDLGCGWDLVPDTH